MAGIPDNIELAEEEMYGERFDIPEPDELLMIGWFPGGEVFRSVCAWNRGLGRVVYIQPGHETHPTYHDANIQRILANAGTWAARRIRRDMTEALQSPALEPRPGA
jgi:trehalose utilization protein